MNPSRTTIVFVAVQAVATASMSWKGSRAICEMLHDIGHDSAKDNLIQRVTRIMSHEAFPITAIVLIIAMLLISFKIRQDRLPWTAFGFVLGGSIFLFGVIMLLVRAVGTIGPAVM